MFEHRINQQNAKIKINKNGFITRKIDLLQNCKNDETTFCKFLLSQPKTDSAGRNACVAQLVVAKVVDEPLHVRCKRRQILKV